MNDLCAVAAVLNRIDDAVEMLAGLSLARQGEQSVATLGMLSGLVDELTEVRNTIGHLEKSLQEKDALIAELQELLDLKKHLRYEEPFYWLAGTESGAKEGPFCQLCYAEKQQLVRLNNPYGGTRWVCPSCNKQFFEPPDQDEKDYYCFCSGE